MAVDPLNSLGRAQRAHEHLNLYRLAHGAEGENRWVAISLMNGACDQHPYATKSEAVRFQPRPRECAYLFFAGMPTLGELRFYLDTCEELFDQGLDLSDPNDYINPEFML